MAYKHGVSISEVSTSINPPVESLSGLPVVVGTAPIHLADDQTYVNKPLLAYSYEEAVAKLGYSSDWESYTLCEFMKSHFQLFEVAPVVFINVLDPATHVTVVTDEANTLVSGKVTISKKDILLSSVVVKKSDKSVTYVKNTDYTAAYDDNGFLVITRLSTGAIASATDTLSVSYNSLNPAAVTFADIIGGVDSTTGEYTGLELVNKVFPLYRLVPGLIVAPGWSNNATVAAVMKAKAGSINGIFKALALVDVDSTSSGAAVYTAVPGWKNDNNYTDPLEVVSWPKVKLDGEVYHFSTQLAGLICATDADNDGIPYVSPSNKSLQANGAVTAAGVEVSLDPTQAQYLNSQGIMTALNFIGGWKTWGNRTGAYPSSSDVKDVFIPNRRMNNWIGNTIIQTYWAKVDNPTNRRQIDSVIDELNIWLNGLTARGALLGGRVEFRSSENSATSLLAGKITFHVLQASPVPGEDMTFVLEYDTDYLSSLTV